MTMTPEMLPDSGSGPAPAPLSAPTPTTQEQPGSSLVESRHAIRVFGIGSTGVRVLETVINETASQAYSVAIHCEAKALTTSTARERVHLEAKLFRGLGSGGDPERGRAAAEENLVHLKRLCDGARVVLIVAGLGGGAGSGISPVLAKAAKEAGALVLCFIATPFECEGSLRHQAAQTGLERLAPASDLIICQPNQKLMPVIDPSTSLYETFNLPNRLLSQAVICAWQSLSCEPVIGLGFSDLCEVIRQRFNVSTFAVASATGADRASEVVQQILSNPLAGGAEALKAADIVGVTLLADASLTMMEVNRVMERIRQECGTAPFMMGASVVPGPDSRLRIGLIMTHAETEPPAVQPVQDPALASPGHRGPGPTTDLLQTGLKGSSRGSTRFAAPAPPTTPERLEKLRKPKTALSRMRQVQLPLEIVSKGRFEKSEPTIHQGEDLDIPTYIRRHVALN